MQLLLRTYRPIFNFLHLQKSHEKHTRVLYYQQNSHSLWHQQRRKFQITVKNVIKNLLDKLSKCCSFVQLPKRITYVDINVQIEGITRLSNTTNSTKCSHFLRLIYDNLVRHRTKFREDSSNRPIFDFQDGSCRYLGFWKFQIFNDWDAQDGRTASACQILSKSLKTRLRYGDFLIF